MVGAWFSGEYRVYTYSWRFDRFDIAAQQACARGASPPACDMAMACRANDPRTAGACGTRAWRLTHGAGVTHVQHP